MKSITRVDSVYKYTHCIFWHAKLSLNQSVKWPYKLLSIKLIKTVLVMLEKVNRLKLPTRAVRHSMRVVALCVYDSVSDKARVMLLSHHLVASVCL